MTIFHLCLVSSLKGVEGNRNFDNVTSSGKGEIRAIDKGNYILAPLLPARSLKAIKLRICI